MSDWIDINEREPNNGQLCELLCQRDNDMPSITLSICVEIEVGRAMVKRFYGVLPKDIKFWRPFEPPKSLSVISYKIGEKQKKALTEAGVKIISKTNPLKAFL